MADLDVAIVGYGPVGATAANLLGGSGLRVGVFEQSSSIFDKPRAIGGDDEFMRAMQWCDVAPQFSQRVAPYNGTQFLGVDHEPIRVFKPPPKPYPLGWPPSFLYVQPELETMLRDRVVQHSNVKVSLRHKLMSIEPAAKHTLLRFETNAAHSQQMVTARYVLACDGANSFIRKTLDFELEDLGFDENWAVIDAWVHDVDRVPQTNVQYCWPSRPATYVLAPRNLRRWELKILPGEDPSEFDDARLLEALSSYVDLHNIQPWRSAVYRFHALVAKRWRNRNVFLLGDAAHQTPPFMGQGLTSGVRDAVNLVWKLLLVEQGKAVPTLLDSYELERKPHTIVLIELAKGAGRIVGELDMNAARQRDQTMREAMRAGQSEVTRSRLIPGLSDGILGLGDKDPSHNLTGTMFIQPLVSAGTAGECLMEDCVRRNFLLLTSTPEAQSWLTREDAEFWRNIGGERIVLAPNAHPAAIQGEPDFRVLHDSQGQYAAWAAGAHVAAAIIRPDRYVFGIALSARELHRQMASLQEHLGLVAPRSNRSTEST